MLACNVFLRSRCLHCFQPFRTLARTFFGARSLLVFLSFCVGTRTGCRRSRSALWRAPDPGRGAPEAWAWRGRGVAWHPLAGVTYLRACVPGLRHGYSTKARACVPCYGTCLGYGTVIGTMLRCYWTDVKMHGYSAVGTRSGPCLFRHTEVASFSFFLCGNARSMLYEGELGNCFDFPLLRKRFC